ncbi:MAG: vitamin B12 dependent methionine synthase [Deltaproteobacteria bacterium]|nr:vitamin B12 dependent methionine synthase [Deltaproteobacteria bacterium]MBW2283709.1 vitamin B12 dependent methionine synthase [Deltaproteobacteria bacterium]
MERMEILNHILVELSIEKAAAKLHAQRTGDLEQVQRVLDESVPLFAPKAVYTVSYVDEKQEDAVVIDGKHFQSKVLRKNLDEVNRVFPFVITLGPALEGKADTCDDLLEKYYFDVIGNLALLEVRKQVQKEIADRYALGGISAMTPGSLTDWPIEEQKPLFSLLKGVTEAIGVRLNESLLMLPRKSVSGIYFPTETNFYSCQLCPRERCEGRKAAYNRELAEEYGVLK